MSISEYENKELQIKIDNNTRTIKDLEKQIKKLIKSNAEHAKNEKDLTTKRFEAEQEKEAAKNSVNALTREVEWLRK